MALLNTDDLAVAMGPGASFDTAQAEYYIDRVSAHIENVTDITFGTVTGAVLRKRVDYDGTLFLNEFPIQQITLVHDVKRDIDVSFTDPCGPYFDQIDTIYGLRPFKIYDVTLDYGQDPIPADIKGVATDAVVRALNSQPQSNLKQRVVGDVSETYGGLLDFPQSDQDIINNYTTIHTTWKTTGEYPGPYRGHNIVLNSPDFCDGECDCS